MSDEAMRPANGPDDPGTNGRLDSWKEIATYLKRDITTVRRWEKRQGLPVHRHLHERRESVYAFTSEIDAWWLGRRNDGGQDEMPAAAAPTREEMPPARASRLAWTLAAAFALTALVLAALLVVPKPAAVHRDELRFAVFPPEQASFGTMTISPDGRRLAFTAATDAGQSQLYVRPLDTLTARPVSGTAGATFPFWDPNGDAIGFFAEGKLYTVDLASGSVRVVCDAPNGRGGTWNRRGIIVFAPDREGALVRVPAGGGSPTAVTIVEPPGERGHMWPEFLPDGNHFLYLADSSQPDFHNLFVGALDGTPRTRLFPLASSAAYGSGYLFFARDRQLLAQPFDAGRLSVSGEPILLSDEVLQQWQLDHKTDFSVSQTGVLAFRSLRGPDTQLVWRDRSEGHSVMVEEPAQYFEPTLSPDQQRIAVDRFDPRPSKRFGFGVAGVTSDIWILDGSSGAASRFTFDPGAEFDPVWAPDGRRIVFSSNRSGNLDLYQRHLDGAAGDELVLASADAKHAQAWSPDGKFVVYATYDPRTRGDLWLLPMHGDRTPAPLLRSEASEEQAQISPDGRWFAYTANESGRSEVYVQAFPTPAGKWQISTNGGGDPRWRADGKELFYIADDRRLMAVAVNAAAAFEPGAAVALFDTGMRPHWGEGRNHYDVSRDGQRFLMMTPVADDRLSPFTVVINWAAAR